MKVQNGFQFPARVPGKTVADAPDPQPATDRFEWTGEVTSLQLEAERLHRTGENLTLTGICLMPAYGLAYHLASSALGLGDPFTIGFTAATATALVGCSLFCSHQGNVTRAQAEDLNRQHGGYPLGWNW